MFGGPLQAHWPLFLYMLQAYMEKANHQPWDSDLLILWYPLTLLH